MTSPRFQFTIRGLLWATFWVAVACVAIGQISFSRFSLVFYNGRLNDQYSMRADSLGGLLVIISLCAVIGALYEQHGKGLRFGLSMAGAVLLIELVRVLILEIAIHLAMIQS